MDLHVDVVTRRRILDVARAAKMLEGSLVSFASCARHHRDRRLGVAARWSSVLRDVSFVRAAIVAPIV